MQTGNMDNEGLDDSELSSYVSQLHPHEQTAGVASDMGGSKWQLKGKRNIRNLTKKPMELIDGKDPIIIPNKCNVSIHKSLCQGKGNIIKTTGINSRRTLGWQGLHHRGKELSYTYEEGDLIGKDFQQTQMVGFGRRYPSILKASSGDRGRSNNSFISSDEDSHVISSSIWEADHQSQEALRGYWEESDGCFDPVYVGRLGDQMESMLLDVDLKVQASYQGERVPLVSLMSKLNGKAIVGHPVQVEILEDGYSDLLPRDDFCGDLPDTDGNAALPQVWRTARRTAMHRVPRPPSSAVEGEEASTLQYSDLESKRPFKKQYTGHVKHKVRMMKGRFSHIRGPRAHKFPKKLLKKATMSSQKTRTLSSIAIEQKPVGKNTITMVSDKNVELHGLIKHERAPMVMVTCVPVKQVFSRIREAIGRPPSAAANHGVLTAGSAERKPPL